MCRPRLVGIDRCHEQRYMIVWSYMYVGLGEQATRLTTRNGIGRETLIVLNLLKR